MKRREKLFCCESAFIVALMNWRTVKEDRHIYTFPVLRGLPADAEFVDAYYSNNRRSWVVAVRHDSFEEVEDGYEAPYVDGHQQLEYVVLESGPNGWLRPCGAGRETEEDPAVNAIYEAVKSKYGPVAAIEIGAMAEEALREGRDETRSNHR